MNMNNEIVVTGINGFVGEHLAKHLKEQGYSVHGVAREEGVRDKVAPYVDTYSQADLLDKKAVDALILKTASAIIHLAGLASVADSFNKPELYKTGNAEMTENLLSSAKSQGFNGRTVVVSTGALYSPDQAMPLNESSETVQGSPYAIGKIKAEEVAKSFKDSGSDVVIVRPFNHIGPGQETGFLVPDLYEELLKLNETGEKTISVGNLNTKRDYTDVRDIVKAYTKLATADSLLHDTYNVSSGVSYSGFEILNYLQQALGLDDIRPVVDQSRVRPTDAMDIIGDTTRISSELGWKPLSNPKIAIEDFVARRQS